MSEEFYYMAKIVIYRRGEKEHLDRMVRAKHKNEAYLKTKKYLEEVYISRRSASYDIEILDTIL